VFDDLTMTWIAAVLSSEFVAFFVVFVCGDSGAFWRSGEKRREKV
jgi:hypothetical protein